MYYMGAVYCVYILSPAWSSYGVASCQSLRWKEVLNNSTQSRFANHSK